VAIICTPRKYQPTATMGVGKGGVGGAKTPLSIMKILAKKGSFVIFKW